MTTGILNFLDIDKNKDGYVSKTEWSERVSSFSDASIVDGIDFAKLTNSLGLQLCPTNYYALPITLDVSGTNEAQYDLYIFNKDQKKCDMESKPLFEKYAAQDWWGFKDADKMSEDEFQTMVKELNDPCRP